MKTIRLSPRLAAVAEYVPQGSKAADVGTDHAYIPVFLAQVGRCSRIIASDVRRGPLESAMRSADMYGVADSIEFVLADGLDGVSPGDADCVILAGMGGETIAGILERADWVRTGGVRLILQPQSKIGELSAWLDDRGYATDDARLVKDDGRIYLVLSVSSGPSRAPLSCAEVYADRLLMQKRDPLLPEYLDLLIKRFEKKLKGLEASEDAGIDVIDHTRLALKGFYRMREETEKWQR